MLKKENFMKLQKKLTVMIDVIMMKGNFKAIGTANKGDCNIFRSYSI